MYVEQHGCMTSTPVYVLSTQSRLTTSSWERSGPPGRRWRVCCPLCYRAPSVVDDRCAGWEDWGVRE